MHTDVEEPGVFLQLLPIPGNDLIGRVGHLFIVEPPLPKQAAGVGVDLGRSSDVVPLPRVGMEGVYLELHEVEIADSGVELAVCQHAR